MSITSEQKNAIFFNLSWFGKSGDCVDKNERPGYIWNKEYKLGDMESLGLTP